MAPPRSPELLSAFSPATQAWFAETFPAPTTIQSRGWPPIARGEHTLLLAPTGSGKTLAAFLACLDRLLQLPPSAEAGVRALYISPQKALAYDVERNLRAPLRGIAEAAARLGQRLRPVQVSLRTGDTPAKARRQLARDPGDLLITTPESLYLLLTSQARSILTTVDTVIIDEIHALAPSKRGAHLMLSLERLVELTAREPQRIGLSATQRPLAVVARLLGGARDGRPREVVCVDAGERPRLDLRVELIEPPQGAAAEPQAPLSTLCERLLPLVRAHRSTIIFTNSRRLCERLAQQLNELAQEELVRAHHGSLAPVTRQEIEAGLKAGHLRGLVATSSMELGVDMDAVELVVQVGSPGDAARGLQRVGRAGHGVGRRSQAYLLPQRRGELLEAAVIARQMLDGEVEPVAVPAQPLDVLAQQIVAMVAERAWPVAALFSVVTRAHNFEALSLPSFHRLLDLLSGRYPSDAFADLRPRLTWDRTHDQLTARRDARLLAITNAGTIADRGLFAVHLGAEGPRIGELDEEMVHELRLGETFLLGASSWRTLAISRDRVVVEPAPGEPGKMPFWRGEGPGRPLGLGRALGAFLRRCEEQEEATALPWLTEAHALGPEAARSLWAHLRAQREATTRLPTDRTLVVERFQDELGDWRICLLSPFGARVHAPWAMALAVLLKERGGYPSESFWTDDGIVLRFAADAAQLPSARELIPSPEELEPLILRGLSGSALFATRFRESAARALLLPRNRPGRRTPLWAQRLRAQGLLDAALAYPDFPLVLETYRECLRDVFDLPALLALLRQLRRDEVELFSVQTPRPSPFAAALTFAYAAAYLYAGDAPRAERQAQALTLDRALLGQLLGPARTRELFAPEVRTAVEAALQGLTRPARHADALHDLLRRLGDLEPAEVAARTEGDSRSLLAALEDSGRAQPLTIAGQVRWVTCEDAGRYREALGLDGGTSSPTPASLDALLLRWARGHGPFASDGQALARRYGLDGEVVRASLRRLVAADKLEAGEFLPDEPALCHPEALRRIRKEALARLRREVAPVSSAVLARFLPAWHGLDTPAGGHLRLREAIAQLEGLPLPFSELNRALLPARVTDYAPRMLDELGAAGELVWVGQGALGRDDGRVALYRREHLGALYELPAPASLPSPVHEQLLTHLTERGAAFFTELPGVAERSEETRRALWDLVWLGLVTNDTFAPLRSLGEASRRRVSLLPGGRWSALAQVLGAPPAETVRAHARARLLLRRYGVVSREAAAVDGVPGGFAALSPLFRAMEEAGQLRRGHFVEGLTGAQFALPEAVERLRGARATPEHPIIALAALDPANPYGALLSWPDEGEGPRGRRIAGAEVVLCAGRPLLLIERGRRLRRLGALAEDELVAALPSLRRIAGRTPHRQLRLVEIDGQPALQSPLTRLLERVGFRVEPAALVLAAD